MGHYDSCYAAENEKYRVEHEKAIRDKLSSEVKALSANDKEMILQIVNNIDNWRGVYNLMKYGQD